MIYKAKTYITSEKFNRIKVALSPQFRRADDKEKASMLGLTSLDGCFDTSDVFGTYCFDFGENLYMDFEINTDNGYFYTVATVWSPNNFRRSIIYKDIFQGVYPIETPDTFEIDGNTYEFGFVIDPYFNSDIDAFYIDNERECIYQVYYNPDSTAGGQWVENILTPTEILVNEHLEANDFFCRLDDECLQCCHDIGTYDFNQYVNEFKSNAADFTSEEYSREELQWKLVEWAQGVVDNQPQAVSDSSAEIISAKEHSLEISGEREDIKNLVEILREHHPEGTLGDLLYQLEKEVNEEFQKECDN